MLLILDSLSLKNRSERKKKGGEERAKEGEGEGEGHGFVVVIRVHWLVSFWMSATISKSQQSSQ